MEKLFSIPVRPLQQPNLTGKFRCMSLSPKKKTMKHLFGNLLLAAMLCTAGTGFLSCKSKTDTDSTTDTSATMTAPADTSSMTQAPPPTISADDSLTSMVKDATKDYPDVTATVDSGVVTLTGNISRAKLPKLMQAVQSTHPKKVTNNLTIK